jgi:hypothetical protein
MMQTNGWGAVPPVRLVFEQGVRSFHGILVPNSRPTKASIVRRTVDVKLGDLNPKVTLQTNESENTVRVYFERTYTQVKIHETLDSVAGANYFPTCRIYGDLHISKAVIFLSRRNRFTCLLDSLGVADDPGIDPSVTASAFLGANPTKIEKLHPPPLFLRLAI